MYFITGLIVSTIILVVFLLTFDWEDEVRDWHGDFGDYAMASLLLAAVYGVSIFAWPMTLVAGVIYSMLKAKHRVKGKV